MLFKKSKTQSLILEFQTKIARTSLAFQRYLIHEMELKNCSIAVKAARGAGKTTLLLQIARLQDSGLAFRVYVLVLDFKITQKRFVAILRGEASV